MMEDKVSVSPVPRPSWLPSLLLPPPMPWGLVRWVALPLAVLIWALAVFWRAPVLLGQQGVVFVVSALTAVPFALVLAYGIATLVVLFGVNRHRLRRVFRPNWGRVIGAVALALVTPFAVFDWLPAILGGVTAILFVPMALSNGDVGGFGIVAVAVGLWYSVAALIVSGTRSRWLRFGLFCLMFWSGYAGLVLFTGVRHFSL
ncbi:hypothetical protein [Cypionkella sinensis]|uniref:Yip1 domain-containing protein n=1 Tax=Cypionkella sinensis TaxID=1756043 RepID=A0ABV7J2S9_9RHOB